MSQQPRELHSSYRPCRDYLFCMVPLIAMAWYLYGLRPVLLVVLSVFVAFICDLLANLLRRTRYQPSDLSSLMFAIIFTMMLPASVPYYVVIIGVSITVLLGKHAFGGYNAYPFHPSAFGFCFVSVCWTQNVYSYPHSFENLGLGIMSTATLHEGVASTLKHGGIPAIDSLDLLIGNYPGPVGTTFCIICLSFLVLLIAHKSTTWHIPVAFLATCALWAMLFPRIQAGALDSVMYEMLSGAIVFSSVFIVAEPTIAPNNTNARLLFGVLFGIGTMIFRYFGVYEMGVCFAALLINPLAAYFDRLFNRAAPKRRVRT